MRSCAHARALDARMSDNGGMKNHNIEPEHQGLIRPGDPPPYTLHNPEGRARTLIVTDHSGQAFPAHMNRLGVADWVLREHVTWDIGSEQVARHLSERFDTPWVAANYSRLIIDVNRAPHDPTSCIPVSAGIAIPGNLELTDADRDARREAFFDPYHEAIARQLDAMRAGGYAPALISIHSCTPVFDQLVRPWHIGVLWDTDPRIARPLLSALETLDGVCVGDNEPYSGRDPHDYTIDCHGEGGRLPHVAIEVRQDLIDTDKGAAHWASLLGDAFESILADDSLYTTLER
jgi:predicted N-formylglutamate amidohydrolase